MTATILITRSVALEGCDGLEGETHTVSARLATQLIHAKAAVLVPDVSVGEALAVTRSMETQDVEVDETPGVVVEELSTLPSSLPNVVKRGKKVTQ